MANTLYKTERLNSKILIRKMFTGDSKLFSIFPLRMVYIPMENQDAQTSVLLSASKKRFKHTVKRDRVKRQLREAYRLHKHLLLQTLTDKQQQLTIASIYLSDELTSPAEIEGKMKTLLAHISERLVWNVYFHIYYCFPYTFTGFVSHL